MSRKDRIIKLAKRVGAEAAPLSHIRDVNEFTAAAAKLSDAELMHAIIATEGERIGQLSDDELLGELAQERQARFEDL